MPSEVAERIERRIDRAAWLDTRDTVPVVDEYGQPGILLERVESDGSTGWPSERALLAQADRITADAQLRRAYNESEGWRALGRARQASARRARVQLHGAGIDGAATARRARSGALDPPTIRRSGFDADGYLAGLRGRSTATTMAQRASHRVGCGYWTIGCDGTCGTPR